MFGNTAVSFMFYVFFSQFSDFQLRSVSVVIGKCGYENGKLVVADVAFCCCRAPAGCQLPVVVAAPIDTLNDELLLMRLPELTANSHNC